MSQKLASPIKNKIVVSDVGVLLSSLLVESKIYYSTSNLRIHSSFRHGNMDHLHQHSTLSEYRCIFLFFPNSYSQFYIHSENLCKAFSTMRNSYLISLTVPNTGSWLLYVLGEKSNTIIQVNMHNSKLHMHFLPSYPFIIMSLNLHQGSFYFCIETD